MLSFTQLDCSGIQVDHHWPPHRAKPLLYFVEPTSLCNAACIFCHYPQLKASGKSTDNSSDSHMMNALAILKTDAERRQLDNIGVSLTPTTGDVLVNKDWAGYARQILNLSFVGWMDLVTNGILLDKKNIEQLCDLSPIEKLDFSISVGGIDRETYKFMFGTDMFVKVQRNVRLLFETLIEKNLKLNITVRLRVPDAAKISREQVIETYNPNKYQWANYEILDTFKDVPLDVPGKESLKIADTWPKKDFDPCGMLKVGALNFNANGQITACGCHYSQMPNEKSLVLGDVNQISLTELDRVREANLKQWADKNEIPKPCLGCQHYHQHEGAHQNKILFRDKYDNKVKTTYKRILNFLTF